MPLAPTPCLLIFPHLVSRGAGGGGLSAAHFPYGAPHFAPKASSALPPLLSAGKGHPGFSEETGVRS